MKKFFFDVESDGLQGEGFAVCALVYDGEELIDFFSGKAEVELVKDQWVIENVLPNIEGLNTFNNRLELRNAFWEFWMKYKSEVMCIVDVGVPVESNWFSKCVNDDLENRKWSTPYPLYDVSTLLYAIGENVDVDRFTYSESVSQKHNPVNDIIASAKTWFKAEKILNIS